MPIMSCGACYGHGHSSIAVLLYRVRTTANICIAWMLSLGILSLNLHRSFFSNLFSLLVILKVLVILVCPLSYTLHYERMCTCMHVPYNYFSLWLRYIYGLNYFTGPLPRVTKCQP